MLARLTTFSPAHWSERQRDRAVLGLLLVLCVLRGLLWIGVYPILKITDEPAHFDNIQFRAENGLRSPRPTGASIDKVLPSGASPELRRTWAATNEYWRDRFLRGKRQAPEERELADLARSAKNRQTTGQSSSMFYPPMYYALAVPVYRLFYEASVLTRLFALRVYSLGWDLLLVACTFLITRWTLRSRALAFAAGLFVMLQPMAAQQMVGVNNDAGVIGLSAAVFALQLWILRGLPAPPRLAISIGLGILTALAVETKPQAYGLLPGCLVLAAWLLWSAPRARSTYVAIGSALGSFILVRVGSALLLDRPLLSQAGTHSAVFTPSDLSGPTLSGFVDFLLAIDDTFLDYLFTTGWGSFCWLDIGLPGHWFFDLRFAASVLLLGAVAAFVSYLLRPATRLFWNPRLVGFSLFTALTGCMIVLFAEYYSRTLMNLSHAVQGRALLFVSPALTLLGAVALGSLVPRRFHTLCAALAVAGTVLVAAGALMTVIGYQYVG